jgi:hypothetical protein
MTAAGEPHSPAAEAALLGACLLSPTACDALMETLLPEDFYVYANQLIAAAIIEQHTVGLGCDPVTIGGRLNELGHLATIGGPAALVTMQADAPSTGNATAYARTIHERATRRRLRALGDRTMHQAADLQVDPYELADGTAADLQEIDTPSTTDVGPGPNIDDLLEKQIEYNWLVPGLFERGDRLLITGGEGQGKSFLLRQLSVQLAAGIHPFRNGETFAPLRVLVVDVENSELQAQRKYRALMEQFRPDHHQRSFDPEDGLGFDADRLHVSLRPQGMNLLSRKDRRWFTGRVQATHPDVIITGPLYKMIQAESKDEGPAMELMRYLDEIRARYECALIIEAHSPHSSDGKVRDLRPIGTSAWLRWPEFGYGLRPEETGSHIVDWVAWRGARDEGRAWPVKLARGRTWPWVNAYSRDAIAQPAQRAGRGRGPAPQDQAPPPGDADYVNIEEEPF